MITLHVIGDSLVKAYGNDRDNFIGGWGDHLSSFFSDEVKVNVYAEGGRSSRSFLNEGRFLDTGAFHPDLSSKQPGPVCNYMQKGDYLLIQFAHNDDSSKYFATYIDRMTPLGAPDTDGIYPTVVPAEDMKTSTSEFPAEYPDILFQKGLTEEEVQQNIQKYRDLLPSYGPLYYPFDCGATYKGYLKFYIDTARSMGVQPVLITAPARQCFKDGRIIAEPGHHGGTDAFGDFPYIRAVRQLGEQENVPVIDLFEDSRRLLENLGPEDARYLASIVDYEGHTIGEASLGRPAKWVEEYDEHWEKQDFGRMDGTHQNRLGSYLHAGMLTEQISEKIPGLRPYLLASSAKQITAPAGLKHRLDVLKKVSHRLNIVS